MPAHLADVTGSDAALRRFLHGLPGVDPVGLEARAAALATRSIKKASKLAAIDLAISSGTKIRASDGGTVISSGYSGSYGYVVRINHGGNRVTLYAHCSKLLVKAGDKVYQGQHIANVGSTGRSTGPHVHFEVIINGVKRNPLDYL